MNIVAIIQARLGSTRLPGKVLLDVAGKSMLERVVERVRRARSLSRVIVATTTNPLDDALVERMRELKIEFFRGDEEDVLARFQEAAHWSGADIVVRVTADCPLIEPALVDRVVVALRDAAPRVSFAANTLVRTFPRGLDTEAMWTTELDRLQRVARQPYHRAHVFPYAYEHQDEFPNVSVTDSVDRSWMRWTVDTADDLELVRRIWSAMHSDEFDWADVVGVLEANPDWVSLNRHVVQKPVQAR